MEELPDFSNYGEVVQEAPTVAADPTNPEAFGGLPKQGDTGDAVFQVQQALADRNITSVGEVDGAFGNNTSLGIQEFQGQVGLPRTGILDQATYTQLVQTPPVFDEEGKVQVTPIERPDFSAFGEVIAAEGAAPVQQETPATNFDLSEDSVDSEVYASRGSAYRPDQIKSYSYYNVPLQGEGPRGESRIHGDASRVVQTEAMEAIINEGRRAGMSDEDIALTLAIAKHESGFNPDASAGTTSAHGLGQFVNKTGEAYGLTDENRWDLNTQARALVEHTQDNIRRAERNGQGRDYVYAYHHDGPSLQYGGLGIGRESVTPNVSKFLEIVSSSNEQ